MIQNSMSVKGYLLGIPVPQPLFFLPGINENQHLLAYHFRDSLCVCEQKKIYIYAHTHTYVYKLSGFNSFFQLTQYFRDCVMSINQEFFHSFYDCTVFPSLDYHNLFNQTLCDSYKRYLQYFAFTNNAGIENFDCVSSDGGGFEMCHLD